MLIWWDKGTDSEQYCSQKRAKRNMACECVICTECGGSGMLPENQWEGHPVRPDGTQDITCVGVDCYGGVIGGDWCPECEQAAIDAENVRSDEQYD